ncbi:LCP family protein [Streptomyces sp. CA2R106]|uniref:LCP family protein n=1 Tax=Streptomyces sp. CA2R106 TaxID=3120153 RepID=UPI003FA7CF82
MPPTRSRQSPSGVRRSAAVPAPTPAPATGQGRGPAGRVPAGTTGTRRAAAQPAGPRRPRRRPPVRLSTRIAGGVALLVITASGVGHAMVAGLNGAINRVDAFGGIQNRPGGSKGTNFLLVGTDGRDGLDPQEKKQYHLGGAPCHCTDTIMLVHLSQDRDRASVVSIPRDTYVQLPDVGPAAVLAKRGQGAGKAAATATATSAGGRPLVPTHPAKINEAYADGGPKLTVSTVEKLTGVHIDHYLEVDFVSFMKTVDVLGGVPVCTTRPLKDSYSGLNLPVGTTTLNGGQALQYVRSRHIDADSDLGRMRRQQQFVSQVIHKITSGGTLANPMRLEKVAGTVLGSVRADEGLRPTDLISLARSMKGFTSKSSEYASVPLSDLSYHVPGVGSTVKWDTAKAGKLWAAVRADQPLTADRAGARQPSAAPRPTGTVASAGTGGANGSAAGSSSPKAVKVDVAPGGISVTVANATGVSGLAGTVQRALRATGFVTPGLATTADGHPAQTTIRYDPRWDRSVKTLAAALPGARLVPDKGRGPVMQVTLGMDFKGRTVRPVTTLAPQPAASTQPAPQAAGSGQSADPVGC